MQRQSLLTQLDFIFPSMSYARRAKPIKPVRVRRTLQHNILELFAICLK